jgi:SepF-like predicted cell division protein (DUF552 family)
MVLKKIFSRKEEEIKEDEFIELDVTSTEFQGAKIPIKVERLDELKDVDRIVKFIREGYILFIRIKTLKDRDITELKRAIDKLKKTTIAVGGEIVGVEEGWIIVSPPYAHIVKE